MMPCTECPTDRRSLAVLHTHTGDLCPAHTRAYLRIYDRAALLSIAAGGGPRNQAERDVVYCPLCSCRKNGWADEPNGIDESCEDRDCPCHDETEAT